ncbi:YdcF family protein [Gordonia sp. SID5947]|uniref:YdcF family protein n=1 Tax=Gordonia sp. SID5947 TaxID=2690315 RepID=UPI001F18799F|nr:YdcF family protein [Gordonia sp. SID5947]
MTIVIATGMLVGGLLHTTSATAAPGSAAVGEATRQVSGPGIPLLLRINPFGTRIVVLGAALNHDGSMKPVLIQRLRAALPLTREFPQAQVITTGGLPRGGRTEAQAMKGWLVARDVAPTRITAENHSRSTVENARNCARILFAGRSTGAVLVTSPDHLTRAMKDFRQAIRGAMPITGVTSR